MEFLDTSAMAEPSDCALYRSSIAAAVVEPDLAAIGRAQRAFAALIETPRRGATDDLLFNDPRVCEAQRTLSALSADDRQHLQRWLCLQLATQPDGFAATPLWRIDRSLARAIDATLVATREALFAPRLKAA